MKISNTLLSILLLTLLSSCSGSTSLDDLVERDGVYYPKFSDVPFTGEVTGKSQGSLKNGKKDGDWVYYWSDGELKEKGNYKNGNKEGDWVSYWSPGKLWFSRVHKDGKLEGDYVSYHRNGQLMGKGLFKNGEKEGVWVVYNEEGTFVAGTGNFKDGVQISD